MTALILASCVAGLFLGPALEAVWARGRAWRQGLDGFALAAVAGLCIVHVLPAALARGGLFAALVALSALLAPRLMRGMVHSEAGSSAIPLMLSLGLHALVEGAAVRTGELDGSARSSLGLAVVAHRVPVGLVVFSVVRSWRGVRSAYATIALLAALTLVGFGLVDSGALVLSERAAAVVEAFVGASLLHVVLDRDYLMFRETGTTADAPLDWATRGHCAAPQAGSTAATVRSGAHSESSVAARHWWSTLGALVGLVLMGFEGAHEGGLLGSQASRFVQTFADLALASAPALLAAFVLAGVMSAFLTPSRAAWLRGGAPFGQALRGVVLGLPLPVCSCGVLPFYEALLRRGVAPAAAMGFLIATPELGLDALLLSVPLLGAPMTGARLVAAFAVAIAVATVVGARARPVATEDAVAEQDASMNRWARLRNGLHFGLIRLFDRTMPWVIFGLLIASLAAPLLHLPALRALPSVAQVPLFALVGIPVYVCASGATPIAAIAIAEGISPGAALAFLLAGPATNVSTFGVLRRLHGPPIALAFGCGVAGLAVVGGWVTNAVLPGTAPMAHARLHAHAAWWQWLSLACLVALFAWSVLRQGPRGVVQHLTEPVHLDHEHS